MTELRCSLNTMHAPRRYRTVEGSAGAHKLIDTCLKALNLNTVLASVSWEMIEPTEGNWDFSVCRRPCCRCAEGEFEQGKWIPRRLLNGDETRHGLKVRLSGELEIIRVTVNPVPIAGKHIEFEIRD